MSLSEASGGKISSNIPPWPLKTDKHLRTMSYLDIKVFSNEKVQKNYQISHNEVVAQVIQRKRLFLGLKTHK